MHEVTWTDVLDAYVYGAFPMAGSADDPYIQWIEPRMRGLLPLDGFHVPKRLRRTVLQGKFEVRIDSAFTQVMQACAANSRPGRESTWISLRILDLYSELHTEGFAHSIESWHEGRLVGGLYGVSVGGAFFGESMFSLETDASKVALVYLVARLRAGGYALLDTQWITEHLTQFGAFEVPRARYKLILHDAVMRSAKFNALPDNAAPTDVLRLVDFADGEKPGN